MTDKQKVLDRLRYDRSICSFSFYNDDYLTHRLAARIYDLKQDGYTINTESCVNPLHNHRSRAVRYTLVEDGRLF